MIIGDFNAKVSEEVQHEDETRAIGSQGLGSRNERGSILVDFCLANRLTTTNTIFQQHPRRKYTWISPNGLVRNQIDYILISSRWESSIKIAKHCQEQILVVTTNSWFPTFELSWRWLRAHPNLADLIYNILMITTELKWRTCFKSCWLQKRKQLLMNSG